MRPRLTNISARPGLKTSRRSATPTRSSCARTSLPSKTPSKWASWSTSLRSSACSSSITSSSTTTSTGETSNSSRWTQTACTSPSLTRSSRTLSSLATRPSSRMTRSSGWHGTSGATASPACSSLRSRAPEQSPYAASVTTWRTRLPSRRRCPPRVSTSARTSCAGSGSRGPSREVETWLPTGASACTTAPCTRTSSASSVLARTTTSAGCWRTASTRSPSSSTNSSQLNTGQPPAYPNTMGRGRSGGITTSWRKAQRNPHRYATMLQFKQAPLAAAPYRAAQPSTPHEQTRAWVHRTGSTPREHPVS